jgi:hypothetical protein
MAEEIRLSREVVWQSKRQGDLAIWQMSNTIQHVGYSDDFEADVLLFSGQLLQQFNPEMV